MDDSWCESFERTFKKRHNNMFSLCIPNRRPNLHPQHLQNRQSFPSIWIHIRKAFPPTSHALWENFREVPVNAFKLNFLRCSRKDPNDFTFFRSGTLFSNESGHGLRNQHHFCSYAHRHTRFFRPLFLLTWKLFTSESKRARIQYGSRGTFDFSWARLLNCVRVM